MQALYIFYQLSSLVQPCHISVQSHMHCAQYVLLTQSIARVLQNNTPGKKKVYMLIPYITQGCAVDVYHLLSGFILSLGINMYEI
jgi:hypothetical protein